MRFQLRDSVSILLFGVLLTAAGCAFTTANVDLAYKPAAGSKSPLSTIKPLKVALLVEDQRPIAERESVGNKRNGFGTITASVKSKSDVLTVISDALKAELANNGHTVVAPKDSNDVVMRVQLKRYWTDVVIHFWDVELVGTINSDLLVSKSDPNKPFVTQPEQGSYRESRQIASESAFESALNGALNEFVRNVSRDPNILKALQEAGRSSSSL